MEFEYTGQNRTSILLNKVIEDKTLLASTRLLAVDLAKNGYVNVGEFFKEISDADLESYVEMSDHLDDDRSAEILLISEMLAIGEGLDNGLDEKDTETMHNRMVQTVVYLTCESLARKGLVKMHYQNMSYGEDMGEKIVVEKL